ncbi:MAG: molybdopterin-dependent oxidoreductase [Thermoproteales archaeon]|nr:molybdopterin-dependent oxidoreductase [Thermoproteales archaeon]
MEKRIVVCPRDCYDTCFLEVTGSGNKVRMRGFKESPVTRGVTCPRALADVKRSFSGSRVLFPHRALNKSEGTFARTTWKQAISMIAEKLKEILVTHGPSSILLLDYAGNRGVFTRLLPQRLWYFLRVARIDYSICDRSGSMGITLHYGSDYGRLPEDLEKTRLLVYWGFNAAVTNLHGFAIARDLQRKGLLRIVTIDALKTETAKASDMWLRVKFGSDVYLALGIANYIIENQLCDERFLKEHTYGFEEFKEKVAKYNLKYVSEKTGLKEDEIVEFAELYAREKPSIIYIGYGLQRRIGGGETVRAISLLPALIGLHRGFYYSNSSGLMVDFDYLSGRDLGEPSRIIPQSKVGEYLEKGEFKFVYIYLTNPVATHPSSQKVKRGLLRDDVFVVVHETHWTDTSLCADIVLPAPTYLEKDDVVFSYWHNYMGYSKAVLKPRGEEKTELEVVQLIARRLELKEPRIYEDPWKALEKAVSLPIVRELVNKGVVKLRYRRIDEYQTPTGKIEFVSRLAEKIGVSPLPRPIEINPPREYPFILVSSAHILYTHTQFEDVYGPVPPEILVNGTDLDSLGVRDGEVVKVYNDKASVKLVARKSDKVPPGVVFTYRSCKTLDGKRINVLTSDEIDELGGSTLNTTFVNLRRLP